MASTKLKIRNDLKKKTAGDTAIYIQYCYQGKIKLFNTGKKIDPLHWDENACQVKRTVRGFTTINSEINQKKREIDFIIESCGFSKIAPTLQYIEEKYKEIGVEQEPELKKIFWVTFLSFVADSKINVGHGTYKHYKVTANHLEAFLKKQKRISILLSEIDYDFVHCFKTFLIKDLDLTNGSANNHLKRLKSFLQNQHDKGYYPHLHFKKVKLFEYKIEDQEKIYLTAEELIELYEFDFSSNPRLEKVRDIFVLGACTGLRYSDLLQLRSHHVKEDKIEIVSIKTKKRLRIPLILFSKDIINKYEGDLPIISNQKMNEYLKEVMQFVVKGKMILPHWRGKSRLDVISNKAELVSSHTAKKTFVMLCVNEDIPVEVVASITGNTVKTLSHYFDIEYQNSSNHLQRVQTSILKLSNK